MVQFCCIVGCGNRSNRDFTNFYRLPHLPKTCDKTSFKAEILLRRRKQWLLNINRPDLKHGDGAYSPGYIRVCSDHFVSGKPSLWSDVDNIDWAPTLNMRYEKGRRRKHGALKRIYLKPSTAVKRAQRLKEILMKQEKLEKELLSMADPIPVPVGRLTDDPFIHRITIDEIVESETTLQNGSSVAKTKTEMREEPSFSELIAKIEQCS